MWQQTAATVVRQGDAETVVRRHFDLPPGRVFAALTTPALLQQWMSAAGRALVECTIDLRSGGSFRYVFRSASGRTFGMSGAYREVVRDQRIVHTESYDGYDWPPLVTTTVLRESRGGTDLEMTIRYPSESIRETDFPNIESGSEEGYARMEQTLAR